MPDAPLAQAPAAASEAPAAPEGSAPQTAAPTTKAAPEAPGSVDDLLTDGNFDEMERILDATESPKVQKPERNAERPQAGQQEEAHSEETEEQTEAENEDGDSPLSDHEEEDSKPLPKNFRFHTEDPKRAKYFRLLKQNPDSDPVQLAALAGYQIPTTAPAGESPASQQPAAEKPDPLKGLRDEIAALEAEQETLLESYEYGDAMKKGKQLTQKMLELQRREIEIAEQEGYQQEYRSSYVDARTRAVAMYPETAKAGSQQFKLVAMLRAHKEQTDPEFIQNPEYPVLLLQELQADYPAIFPKPGTPPAPASPARVPAQPKNPARPLGQVVTGNTGAKAPSSRAELEQNIDNLSLDDLAKLADQVGTQTPEKRRR